MSEWTDLDRVINGRGGLLSPLERSVEVFSFDDVEAAEMLLRFGEGSVCGQEILVGDAHDRGGIGTVQGAAEEVRAGQTSSLLREHGPLS